MSEELERVYTRFMNNQVCVHVVMGNLTCTCKQLPGVVYTCGTHVCWLMCVPGPQAVGQCCIPVSEAPQLMGEGLGAETALCGGEE